jgi:DNA-binding transcriptional regulator YhcF (GntR family)
MLSLPQHELALLIGASPATVQRELRRLRQRGIIRTQHRHSTVVDPAARTAAASHPGWYQ